MFSSTRVEGRVARKDGQDRLSFCLITSDCFAKSTFLVLSPLFTHRLFRSTRILGHWNVFVM
jgi:hypothetical protein